MKVYICGSISGHDKEDVWNKFYYSEIKLIKLGYEPINPLRINGINSLSSYFLHEQKKHHEYLRRDISALCECDYIYIMDCAKTGLSKGCNLEIYVAEQLKINQIQI